MRIWVGRAGSSLAYDRPVGIEVKVELGSEEAAGDLRLRLTSAPDLCAELAPGPYVLVEHSRALEW